MIQWTRILNFIKDVWKVLCILDQMTQKNDKLTFLPFSWFFVTQNYLIFEM